MADGKGKKVDFKYFNEKTDPRIKGVKETTLWLLDAARDRSGVRYIVTDGLRTRATNTDPNAAKDSAHLTGNAVDTRCTNGSELYHMLYGMLAYFCRIGIYVRRDPKNKRRLIPTHIHVDDDAAKPQRTIWIELED